MEKPGNTILTRWWLTSPVIQVDVIYARPDTVWWEGHFTPVVIFPNPITPVLENNKPKMRDILQDTCQYSSRLMKNNEKQSQTIREGKA